MLSSKNIKSAKFNVKNGILTTYYYRYIIFVNTFEDKIKDTNESTALNGEFAKFNYV